MFFLTIEGRTVGPMTEQQIFSYDVNRDTPVCKDGKNWAPLFTYPELMEKLNEKEMSEINDEEVSSKKTLCGIMAIVFGEFGVQYFCLGRVGAGFLTILLSIITCGLWGVVTFIQGIMMLCMSNLEFKKKYIDSTSALPLF